MKKQLVPTSDEAASFCWVMLLKSAIMPPLFPLVAANTDTGTHMGYVRAFIGSDTESRDGEVGISIIIHSTIPGASGRNFNIRLSNKTPYAYKPVRVIGHGGLLATNSRSYHPNSFPAPMPIGADGETFVPISTFRGAPSGSTLDSSDSIRAYDGLGSTFKVTTVASPSTETTLGVEQTSTLSSGISAGATSITVSNASGFSNSGSGDIDGDSFSWTGKSSNTLSGCTLISSDHSSAVTVSSVSMTSPTHHAFYSAGTVPTSLSYLAVSTLAEDYLKRITQTPSLLIFGRRRSGTT